MEGFSIIGTDAAFIKIYLQEVYEFPEKTCCWGGYDVKASIEIKSGCFEVTSIFYVSTGQIYELYEHLKTCNQNLSGTVDFISYEKDLKFSVEYDALGHCAINGTFAELHSFNYNELKFEFDSDQTFMSNTLLELELLVKKYGDMKGVF